NKGGADDKWFEDASAKVGLGPEGIGTEPSNFLTAFDIFGDGRTDFVLNLTQPMVARNDKGVFKLAEDTGLAFPALPRPSVAYADFINTGKVGVFVTTNERSGALRDWQMIGTFSEEEDKSLAAKPDFSPEKQPEVKIKGDSWEWREIRAKPNGMLVAGRRQP